VGTTCLSPRSLGSTSSSREGPPDEGFDRPRRRLEESGSRSEREVLLAHGHDQVAGPPAETGRQPPTEEGLVEGCSSKASGRRWPLARIIAEVLTVGGLIGFAWFERGTIERSMTFVRRADWKWLVVSVSLELVSLAAFARAQQIILRAKGVRISEASMVATTFAGNAISASLPLIGPGAGTAFTFGRFRRVADDAASAGWALVISGLISSLVLGVMLATGAAVSGDHAAAVGGAVGGAAILVAAIVGALSLRLPQVRGVAKSWVLRLVKLAKRFTRHPDGDPDDLVNSAFDQLLTGRMGPGRWALVVGLSGINWLASVGCLMAAILAVGAGVPWAKLLLIYCTGSTAGSFNLTPGGLGVVEGVLTAGLVAAGMRSDVALGSVLIFRLVSFWLVILVGWTIYSMLRRARRHDSHPDAVSAIGRRHVWRRLSWRVPVKVNSAAPRR
jgi:putative heme transporter